MRIGVFALSLLMLGGCLATPELPLLSDVELAEDAPESGLIAPDSKAPETVLQELQSVENVPDVATETANPTKNGTPMPTPAAQTPRKGIFALFGKRDKGTPPKPEADAGATVGGDEEIADTEETVIVASIEPKESVRPRRERSRLFGPRRAKSGQLPQVGPDVVLPFGQIGLACGVRGKALGKEVDRFPERGRGYRLYDTKPSTTGPRTHFITGFKDGCPRQLTASLVLLDSPILHEQLLSVKSSQPQHSTTADKAFQKIRAQVCHVGRGKACPEKRIDEMEKSMAFVTTYERFGGNARWNEILLNNGKVAANSADTP